MNMYIGNLSYNVRESDLRDVMEEFGTVDSVKLIIDRDTRRSKGFAFVEMPEDSEAQNAIRDLNGATYEGRQMVVKEALPRNYFHRIIKVKSKRIPGTGYPFLVYSIYHFK